MDDIATAGQLLAQVTRSLQLLSFRLMRLRLINEQLLAGVQELTAGVRVIDQARQGPHDDATIPHKGFLIMMALEGAPAVKATSKSFTNAQVVVLRVQGGDYAVPINRVQEIVRVPEITRVPHAQPGVEGVINLRGRVLPVVDLATRLGLVDGVSEVLRVSASDVEPPSLTTTGHGPTAVLGVAKLGERLVLLLDLDAALVGAAIDFQPPPQLAASIAQASSATPGAP